MERAGLTGINIEELERAAREAAERRAKLREDQEGKKAEATGGTPSGTPSGTEESKTDSIVRAPVIALPRFSPVFLRLAILIIF